MKSRSLNNLKRNIQEDNLFDLTEIRMIFPEDNTGIQYDRYVVPQQYIMRPDLISNLFYGTVDYTDLILFANNIINPMNIQQDMVLYIPKKDFIEVFYINERDENIAEEFLNKSKVTKTDKKREKAKENDRANLPPTINQSGKKPYEIKGDKIIIGGNSF